jgi:hypothetical protein
MTSQLAVYVGLVDQAEQTLADALRAVAAAQAAHPDVYFGCLTLAKMADTHRSEVAAVAARYGEAARSEGSEPERLHAAGLGKPRTGPLGLLRDLQDLHVLAHLVQSSWTVIQQAAQGLRDHELLDVATHSVSDTGRQIAWLETRMKAAAPQALIVGR